MATMIYRGFLRNWKSMIKWIVKEGVTGRFIPRTFHPGLFTPVNFTSWAFHPTGTSPHGHLTPQTFLYSDFKVTVLRSHAIPISFMHDDGQCIHGPCM